MPPKWALGYQQCRWSYETAERVSEVCCRRSVHVRNIWCLHSNCLLSLLKLHFPRRLILPTNAYSGSSDIPGEKDSMRCGLDGY